MEVLDHARKVRAREFDGATVFRVGNDEVVTLNVEEVEGVPRRARARGRLGLNDEFGCIGVVEFQGDAVLSVGTAQDFRKGDEVDPERQGLFAPVVGAGLG